MSDPYNSAKLDLESRHQYFKELHEATDSLNPEDSNEDDSQNLVESAYNIGFNKTSYYSSSPVKMKFTVDDESVSYIADKKFSVLGQSYLIAQLPSFKVKKE